MGEKINVGVIFGGRSGEHEVSIRSARAVIEAIDREKYFVIPLSITREGRWLSPADSSRLLPDSTRSLLNPEITGVVESLTILGDPTRRGLLSLDGSGKLTQANRLDVLFPVLHGTYGEDGTLQGLFDMADVPYVGCGVLASSCGMDKVTMKALFRDANLPICRHIWFLRAEWEIEPAQIIERVKKELGLPCFVKPANLGSSVGVSRAHDAESLKQAIDLAACYDRKIMVEELVNAREIECAVMGNDEPVASLPGEYVVHDQRAAFLDYTEKYSNTGHVEFVVPAPIPQHLETQIREMSLRAFKSVDGSGLARVDFFLRREDDELLINELNTLPGLTEVSGFPKMWEASGMTFTMAIDRLIELAFERQRDRSRNQTSF
ncbi:MAG: D-alanine--D-alanine ligase [Acidobacteria bacterium]|nr:D-alanine--D-alanine ligase [Acidobacteriota bacterium]